jgi:hypothetical protein
MNADVLPAQDAEMHIGTYINIMHDLYKKPTNPGFTPTKRGSPR